jgi:hypothetical protein
LNVVDAGSRRVNFVGPVQPTGTQETEAFRKGEGVKASRIQVIERIHVMRTPVGSLNIRGSVCLFDVYHTFSAQSPYVIPGNVSFIPAEQHMKHPEPFQLQR